MKNATHPFKFTLIDIILKRDMLGILLIVMWLLKSPILGEPQHFPTKNHHYILNRLLLNFRFNNFFYFFFFYMSTQMKETGEGDSN
jgi:hypothetical protein